MLYIYFMILFSYAHDILQNEIDLLSIICHPNIISLVGYCFHAETRFLVYEMMENGTLEAQLHGIPFASPL